MKEVEWHNPDDIEGEEEPTSATTNFVGTRVSDEEYKTVPINT